MREKLIDETCANERATSVLARPGKSSISTWPSASSAEQHELERVALADDRLLDLVEDPVGERAHLVEAELRHRRSSSVTSSSSSRVDHVRLQPSCGGGRSGRISCHVHGPT